MSDNFWNRPRGCADLIIFGPIIFFVLFLLGGACSGETIWLQDTRRACGHELLTLTRVYERDGTDYTLIGGNVSPLPAVCDLRAQTSYDRQLLMNEPREWFIDDRRWTGPLPLVTDLPRSSLLNWSGEEYELYERFSQVIDLDGLSQRTLRATSYLWEGAEATALAPVLHESRWKVGVDGMAPLSNSLWSSLTIFPPSDGNPIREDGWSVTPRTIDIPVAITGPWLDTLPTPDRIIDGRSVPEPSGIVLLLMAHLAMGQMRSCRRASPSPWG